MILWTVLWRNVLFIAAWWVLTQGRTDSWGVGVCHRIFQDYTTVSFLRRAMKPSAHKPTSSMA